MYLKSNSGSMRANFCLTVLSLIVSFTIAEFSFRFFLEKPKANPEPKTNWAVVPEHIWTEYHPTLGWFHQKSKKATLVKDDWSVEINTNSAGLRGLRDYALEKPPGVTRIVVLGDSFTFGFGVKDNQTFSSLLEQSNPNLEALNFGVAGYGLDQILITYREIAREYKADLVIIGIFPEQFWRSTRSFTDAGYAKPYFTLSGEYLILHNVPTPKPFELKYDQFFDLIESKDIKNLFEKSVLYRSLKRSMIQLGKDFGWVDPEWILGERLLKTLISEIKADGREVVLVIIPPERWAKTARIDSQRRALVRFAEREQVPMIDLTPIFFKAIQTSNVTEYYIKDDWHWTAKGHQLAASILNNFILEHYVRR